jgi:heptosyltransferase I
MKKIVFIRLDKIGDLIASLPVDQLSGLKDDDTRWVIAEGLGWIAEQAEPPRKFIELRNHPSSFRKLHTFLKTEKPDAVVVFYAPWWVSLACWLADVRLRGGRKSQWHSFLFFNKGLRQSRSQAEKHEADYNRELVEHTLGFAKEATPFLTLKTSSNPHLLEKNHLTYKAFAIVHPGMFGSALNWPQDYYNDLIESLINETTVVVTGTKGDERFLTEIKKKWRNHERVRLMQDRLNMPELLSLLTAAKFIVAPSTGVLHLAASLGTPAIGIYSPIQAHHPKRWGPRGHNVAYLLPENPDLIDCMSTIQVKTVLQKIKGLAG